MVKKRSLPKRRRTKYKLKKNTLYTILAVMLLGSAGIIFVSFSQSSEFLTRIFELLFDLFGIGTYLIPFNLVALGFLVIGSKTFLSKPNLSIGMAIITLSVVALAKAGHMGEELWLQVADILSEVGAWLVYLGTLIIGCVILFNTSLDKLLDGLATVLLVIKHAVLGTSDGKKKGVKEKKEEYKQALFAFNKSPFKVKGSNTQDTKQPIIPPPVPGTKPAINTKQSRKLSEELVVNAPKTPGSTIWEFPAVALLDDQSSRQKANRGDLKKNASIIERTLESFGIAAHVVEVNLGPAVTQYAIEIALGTKLSKITALANDLALALAAPTGQIRIEAPIPGRSLVGIEIPNHTLEFVTLKQMMQSPLLRDHKSKLAVALGLDVSGNPVVADVAKMPHVLIAGTTGSGKSVLINAWICSLLYRATPDEVKLIMVDPKRVELVGYNGIPHLLTPVIVEADKILSALKWALQEMDRRYKQFSEVGVRNIDSFNELSGFQALPYIVVFVDELADLMAYAPVEVEDSICRLAQMARATGIHLVVATQRPSVDVITGLIKANIPARIAFNVSSMIDSRVIIDMPGAEKMLGRGDMLYIPPDQAKPTRIQGTFISEKEVQKTVAFLKTKNAPVEYTEEVTNMPMSWKKSGGTSFGDDGRDELFEEAVRTVCQYDRASASLLQRRLSIGYARAARVLDQLEQAGIVGPAEGSKPRDVLVRNPDEYFTQAQTAENSQPLQPQS